MHKVMGAPRLSPFRLQLEDTTAWVTYKQQKSISHSFRVWKVQEQGTGRLSVW